MYWIIGVSDASSISIGRILSPMMWFGHVRYGTTAPYFGTSVVTQQWAQPVTAGVHGVINSKKCRLDWRLWNKFGPRQCV